MTRRHPVALALALMCAASFVGAQSPPPRGRVIEDTIRARSLAGNLYGDSPNRIVVVYLPPSYSSNTARRYPVIYLLHGFDVGPRQWERMTTQTFGIQPAMDSLIASGVVREMIVVMPDAQTRLGGSFYTNSTAAGNWDDFIAKELVTFIDGKYRTVARPESRGLAGHSMGGYGALTIGMRHAGAVFGAVYSMSACCTRMTREDGLAMQSVWPALAASVATGAAPAAPLKPLIALAAALSPDTMRPPLFVDLPFAAVDGHVVVIDSVFNRWIANTPYDMLPRYRDELRRLRGLALDVGTRDQEVLPALVQMDSALTRAGIAHTFDAFDGGHVDHIGVRLTGAVFPFFSRTLTFP
jgi:enterochelin esterase-like enzyme